MSKPNKPKWVELLEKKFPKKTTAADVIAAIFSFIPKEEFSSHTETIHRQIKEFSEMPEYNYLFAGDDKELPFVDSYPFPHSPLLERIIMRLKIAKFLISQNPDYLTYRISEDAQESMQKAFVTKFTEEDQKKLKEMGQKLYNALEAVAA